MCIRDKSTGAQGATGSTGAQGATGSTGAQGAAGSSVSISNNANNRVITGGSGTNLVGESNLTFDGTKLNLTTGGAGFRITRNSQYIELDGNTGNGGDQAIAVSSALRIQTGGVGNSYERLRITSGGNIGVAGATGTDFSLLDGMVINTANGSAGLIINSSSSSHNAYMSFGYGSGSGTSHNDQYSAYHGRVGDDNLIFGTNNNIRASIDSNGNFNLCLTGSPAQSTTEQGIILPGAAYTEQSGHYTNLEGKIQKAYKASYPPGEAKEDWIILNELSKTLNNKELFLNREYLNDSMMNYLNNSKKKTSLKDETGFFVNENIIKINFVI